MRKALLSLLIAAAATLGILAVLAAPLGTGLPETVYLEDMTWVEVREALDAGKTSVIVPTAGHEQNGPHMVLGKHRHVVHYTAGRIAEALGDTLVAPVVTYVPEGSIEPRGGHMLLPGTISVPPPVFAGILEAAARSLRAHGFTEVYFVGDSGGNQAAQAEVAARLDREWAGTGGRVLHVGDYYAANGQVDWLKGEGETEETIGTHAGIRDTSELLTVHPEGVRPGMFKPRWGLHLGFTGSNGDPTRASAERGRHLLDLKIAAALRQIRKARADRPK